jgi:hypothetical protein
VVTIVEPETTAAVSVTWLPDATDPPDATAFPAEAIVSVVVVAAGAAQACREPRKMRITEPIGKNSWQENFRFNADSMLDAAGFASKQSVLGRQQESTPVVYAGCGVALKTM